MSTYVGRTRQTKNVYSEKSVSPSLNHQMAMNHRSLIPSWSIFAVNGIRRTIMSPKSNNTLEEYVDEVADVCRTCVNIWSVWETWVFFDRKAGGIDHVIGCLINISHNIYLPDKILLTTQVTISMVMIPWNNICTRCQGEWVANIMERFSL